MSPSARTGSPSSAQHWMVSVSDSETTIDMSEKYLGRVLNGGASASVTVSENSSLDETSTPADLPSSFSSPVIKMVVDGVTETLDMNHGEDESASHRSTSSSSRALSRSNSPHGRNNNMLNNNKRRRVVAASSNLHKRHPHKASSASTARTIKHHNTRRNHNHDDHPFVERIASTRTSGIRSPMISGVAVSPPSSSAAKGILTTRHGKTVYKNPMATGILYIYKDTHRAEFVRAK